MDGRRFDEWNRRLVSNTSRRQALRVLAGSGAAGLLTHLGGDLTAAQEVDADGTRCLRKVCRNDNECNCSRRITCDNVKRSCQTKRGKTQCCGRRRAPCKADCDCCKAYRCEDRGPDKNTCQRA